MNEPRRLGLSVDSAAYPRQWNPLSPWVFSALHTLMVIEEEGSYKAAAFRLDKTYSNINVKVRKLETILGTRLIESAVFNKATLTSKGRWLVDQYRDAMRACETAILSIERED